MPSALLAAHHLIDGHDFGAAEATLRAYLAEHEASADAHALLGYTLLHQNRPKESLAEYTRAAAMRTPSSDDLRAVADDYVLLSDYPDADHWMSRALLMNERDPELWYSLGRIRYSLQRFDDAAKCFLKALALQPRSVKAADNLGLTYEALNRTDDAIREYRQALAWQADAAHPSEQPMLNLAILLVHQGELDEALSLLKRANSITPDEPRIHDQLGHIHLQRNELEEAEREFERAVALAPDSAAYHFLLGQVYRREGKVDKSQAEFKAATRLNGTHSSPL